MNPRNPSTHVPPSAVLLCAFLLSLAAPNVVRASAVAQEDPLAVAYERYRAYKDQEALNLVNEILLDRPLDLDASLLRARCLAELGRWPEAQRTLERIKLPTFEVRLMLAECLAANGDSVKSLELLDELLLEDSANLGPRIKRAKALLKTGQFQRAETELSTVLHSEPRNAEACLVMGMIYEGTRRFREAGRVYLRLVQEPQSFDPYDGHLMKAAVEGLGRSSMTAGLYDQAASWYEQLRDMFPERAFYWFNLGIAQGMKNKFQDAIGNIRKAVEMDPDNLIYRIRLAEVYYSQKMYTESIEQFEILIGTMSDPSLPSLRLAEMYMEQGELPKALGHLEVVLNLLPESADVQSVAGKLKEKVGEPDAAKAHYRKAMELDPLAFASLYRLALLLARSEDAAEKGESTAMLERYQRVVEYLPDIELARAEINLTQGSPEVFLRMAAILNAAQEYPLAGAWVQRAMNVAPQNPKVFVWAGMVAANLQRLEDSRTFFGRALEFMGATPDPMVVEYVRMLDAGEALPVPLGQLIRPTTETPGTGKSQGF